MDYCFLTDATYIKKNEKNEIPEDDMFLEEEDMFLQN